MSSLSVFQRPKRPTAHIKVVDALNGHISPDEIYHILEEGSLLEAVQNEVSPAERLQVTANLVPFLSADEQEKVFELLEDSLSRTKSKKDLKEFNDSTMLKAQEFKQLWADNNLRKKMKKEMAAIPPQTSSRKI